MQPPEAASASSAAAVRSAAFAALAEQDVPVDTAFFHKCVFCNPTRACGVRCVPLVCSAPAD